ncbi:hypothetical protein Isop_3429 [Isosphaera pallida ATCC 43644]|uniref:Uncharacterized protein n=1 Tax=Isosphaera pallida (strain ATCC 43644 / DSM 9630 / IS1B) TaxID=575540 RepID=E8R6T5_ISOPI|nr:hypothetical protein [Isosphaera pallida]ADV63987.1 hypothetical protein Isop_3429 [Isosphaera pallida ATCC 43644]
MNAILLTLGLLGLAQPPEVIDPPEALLAAEPLEEVSPPPSGSRDPERGTQDAPRPLGEAARLPATIPGLDMPASPVGPPDGYGWYDTSFTLPLGDARTPDYYFPRWYALPARQAFLSTYYNPYQTQGQRYIPYNQFPPGLLFPVFPYREVSSAGIQVPLPLFRGRVEAKPTSVVYSSLGD